jgi:drug/metabolite transporter (DMT)-like permease
MLRHGMRRRLVAFAVVGALVCGQLLAYANPPDPTWIAGFWDDADFDDVIVRVTSTSSVAETGLLSALAPHWVPIWTLPLAGERLDPHPALASHQPRGPPLA